jgi:Domain of unknown function (DUF6434)
MAKEALLNWHSAPLTCSTKIDRAYKSTQNVRRFFKKEIGEHFRFTREYMQYLKTNNGISLEEAVAYWKTLNQ